jgi:hypothetical protein
MPYIFGEKGNVFGGKRLKPLILLAPRAGLEPANPAVNSALRALALIVLAVVVIMAATDPARRCAYVAGAMRADVCPTAAPWGR